MSLYVVTDNTANKTGVIEHNRNGMLISCSIYKRYYAILKNTGFIIFLGVIRHYLFSCTLSYVFFFPEEKIKQ